MSTLAPALADANRVMAALIATIQEHRAYLSEIDGAIGDGDHGVNMSKGFANCAARLERLGGCRSVAQGFEELAHALLDDIGGSMGPLYGSFFMSFGEALGDAPLDAATFGRGLAAGLQAVQDMGEAKVGDKTLVDTLVPAQAAYAAALDAKASFAECLRAMSEAAEAGKESTRALQARVGRAARLGPRSVGVLDAGATSCCLILQSMARSLAERPGAGDKP